jgi:hypothetical protein
MIRRLRGRVDVAGIILAHLWRLDAAEGLNLVKLSPATMAFIADRAGMAKFLSFLNYGQLRELAGEVPQYGPSVAELLFAGAVCHGRMELLEYLDPLLDIVDLHPLCAAFYRASIDGCHGDSLAPLGLGWGQIQRHEPQRIMQGLLNIAGKIYLILFNAHRGCQKHTIE